MPTVPPAVLFACNLNHVRSPMAAALLKRIAPDVAVDSRGLRPAEDIDPFVLAVMHEIGVDLTEQRPKGLDTLNGGFGLIIALTPEAHERALELARGTPAQVEYWPVDDPTQEDGAREQRLEAYRRLRDDLDHRLRDRFGGEAGA